MTNTADLRAAAEAATPGPWEEGLGGNPIYPRFDNGRRETVYPVKTGEWTEAIWVLRRQHDAAYIALASPDRILGILSELERKTAALETMVEVFADGLGAHAPTAGFCSLTDEGHAAIEQGRAALEGEPE